MEREWVIWADEQGEIPADRLAQAAVDAAAVVHRLGGQTFIGSDREQLGDGQWVTNAVLFQWRSHLPTGQPRNEQPPAEPASSEPEVEVEPAPGPEVPSAA